MITLENISKQYAEQSVIKNVNLQIEHGELCTLIGPSGCGKSTLLRMMNRMIEPTSGTIAIHGQEITQQDEVELRRHIGYVIQNVGLFPHYTIAQNLAVVPRLLGKDRHWIEQRTNQMLELIQIPKHYAQKYPHELSGGQAQRIGVARALIADPPVLLMDEPFSAVDPQTRWNLQQSFLEIQQELKKTVVFVTHDIEEALVLGDTIALMNDGEIIQKATPQTLLLEPKADFVTEFIGYSFGVNLLAKIPVSAVMMLPRSQSGPKLKVQSNLKQALALMLAQVSDHVSIVDEAGQCLGEIHFQDIQKALRGVK